MPELLQKLRLSHSGISVEGTPRRLAVLVSGLAARQDDAEDRIRGPPAKVQVCHEPNCRHKALHMTYHMLFSSVTACCPPKHSDTL